MKTLILLLVVLGAGFLGWIAWQEKPRKHDPVEYDGVETLHAYRQSDRLGFFW